MGVYKYLGELWNNPKANLGELWQKRLIKWRREPSIVRVERPLRLDRARTLGYRAKKGFIVARVKVLRGGRQREKFKSKRKSKNLRRIKIVEKNYQSVAEERCQKKFINLEVLNSYYVGQDGRHYWYEIIMVDPSSPEIKSDRKINWVCEKQHKHRSLRGLTSAGRKGRGLRKKGKGAEKVRPSKYANRKKRIRRYGHKR